MGRLNDLMLFVSDSITRISRIFQTPLVVTFSYFLLHNDSSRFWYFYRFFHRIVSGCSSGKQLWRACYGSHTDCLSIVSISPSDKSFSHVANDVIRSANIDTKWTACFMGWRHTKSNDIQLHSLARYSNWGFDLAHFHGLFIELKIKNPLIVWNLNQTLPKRRKKEYF